MESAVRISSGMSGITEPATKALRAPRPTLAPHPTAAVTSAWEKVLKGLTSSSQSDVQAGRGPTTA